MIDKFKYIIFPSIFAALFSFFISLIAKNSFIGIIIRVTISSIIMMAISFLIFFLYEKYLKVDILGDDYEDNSGEDSAGRSDEINFKSNLSFDGIDNDELNSIETNLSKSGASTKLKDEELFSGLSGVQQEVKYIKKNSSAVASFRNQFTDDHELMAKAIRKEIQND